MQSKFGNQSTRTDKINGMNFTPKKTFSSEISEHLASTKESSVLGVRALSSKTHAFAPGFGSGQNPRAPRVPVCLHYFPHPFTGSTDSSAVKSEDMGSGSTVE